MDITQSIPSGKGFTLNEDSLFNEVFQKVAHWQSLFIAAIEENNMKRYAGIAFHLMPNKEIGGIFATDVTIVKTLENDDELWVENPPEHTFLTFACGAVTRSQTTEGTVHPKQWANELPPIAVIQFFIEKIDGGFTERAQAELRADWIKDTNELILPKENYKLTGTWEQGLALAQTMLGALSPKILQQS